MKNRFGLLFTCIIASCFLTNCLAQSKKGQPVIENIHSKAKLLQQLYRQSNESSNMKEFYRKRFFEEFPNTFSELNKLYGYNDDTPAILYNDVPTHIYKLFNNLNEINDTTYYRKIISISIGGHWDADAVEAFQEGLKNKVSDKPELTLYLLRHLNDKQILSFWYFYFDSPHPVKAIPQKLLIIKNQDTHIYKLMEEALKKVQQYWKNS